MWMVMLAGCVLGGSSPDGTAYVGEAVPYDDLPAAFARATCDRRVRCDEFDDDEWPDCYELFEGIVWTGWLDEGDGCVDYDPQLAGNCVAAHDQAPCELGNDFQECITFQLDVCDA